MRIMRFIGVIAILCVGMVGHGGAQKRSQSTKVRDTGTAMDTAEDRRFAQLASLLDKFLQCVDLSVPDTRDTYLKCVIYNNKVQETSLDVYLPPALASKLSVKLSAEDIKELKGEITRDMEYAYAYSRQK